MIPGSLHYPSPCSRWSSRKEAPRRVSWAMLTGMLRALGLLCYLQAVQRQSIAIVAMVTALYPIITVALSVLVLKDKIGEVQWLGILFALCSLACMSWPSK